MKPAVERYGSLMRLYPAWYREERGDEMLSTFDERAEGKLRLAEIVGIVRGAFVARVRANRRGWRTGAFDGLWVGAAIWLWYVNVFDSLFGMSTGPDSRIFLWNMYDLALPAALPVLAAFGRRRLIIFLGIVAAGPAISVPFMNGFWGFGFIRLALPIILVVAVRPPTWTRQWRWFILALWVAVPLALTLTLNGNGYSPIDRPLYRWLDLNLPLSGAAAALAVVLLACGAVGFVRSGRFLVPIVALATLAAGDILPAMVLAGADIPAWIAVFLLAALVVQVARGQDLVRAR